MRLFSNAISWILMSLGAPPLTPHCARTCWVAMATTDVVSLAECGVIGRLGQWVGVNLENINEDK